MNELQNIAKQSLNGTPSHRIYSTKCKWNLYLIIYRDGLLSSTKEEKYGKLINVKPYNGDIGIADNKHQEFVKQLQDITDEEGLRLAYETKDGLYQHYNKLCVAGTKDFPVDHIDYLKLPFDDTLNETKRGRDADAYIRSHHEIDTVIGHSLGGAVALSLERQCKT